MVPVRSGPLTSAICAALLLAAPPPARADDASPLSELVDAAAQRLQVADDVAAVKWQTRGAIEDPARVQQQLASLAAAAESEHLDAGYVTQVFTDQIEATEAVEHHRFAQWTLNPATAPAVAPDLAISRARIDGFNHVMLDQIGLRWQQLHSRECAAQLDQATRDVSDARHLDEFSRQALTAATRDYCDG
ncbi:chorismate mutase [Mycolicibacter longobardus]|uniref:Chorismate mutase n=1 Tax=Mycolicibacter longobardus TaxID=1108812 RepID=A0A1X1YIP6_9MYCO|nr:chorismate mutase [Mycolicibacter longobardus]ORW10893.1 chorismate mutase [Mycolicibacter longobardus]